MKTAILAITSAALTITSPAVTWSKTAAVWFTPVGSLAQPNGTTAYFQPLYTSPLPSYKVYGNSWTSSGETGLPHWHYNYVGMYEPNGIYNFTDNHPINLSPADPMWTPSDCIYIQWINYGIPFEVAPNANVLQTAFTVVLKNALNNTYEVRHAYIWPGDTWATFVVRFNWQRPDELLVHEIDSGSCTTYNCQPDIIIYEQYGWGN